ADGLAQRARDLRLGRPSDPATTTGPLISAEHREKVLFFYGLAEEIGAKILVGGGIPAMGAELDRGWWIEPTLWTGLTNADRPLREEIFGPAAARPPCCSADARRHVLGQHVVPARSAFAVRRRGTIRNRARGWGFLARV